MGLDEPQLSESVVILRTTLRCKPPTATTHNNEDVGNDPVYERIGEHTHEHPLRAHFPKSVRQKVSTTLTMSL